MAINLVSHCNTLLKSACSTLNAQVNQWTFRTIEKSATWQDYSSPLAEPEVSGDECRMDEDVSPKMDGNSSKPMTRTEAIAKVLENLKAAEKAGAFSYDLYAATARVDGDRVPNDYRLKNLGDASIPVFEESIRSKNRQPLQAAVRRMP